MKLIIQIPCLNEEKTITETIHNLPKSVPGIDVIEYLVIDDGSTDNTVRMAESGGAHHILSLGSNRGLAGAFSAGMNYAVEHGADILVNTDADNQYCGKDIAKLVAPILANQAEIVIGCRPISNHPEFSPIKKFLQKCGSWVLRRISKTNVSDAASGFRAFSRTACQRIFIHSRFSYCMETLIQAGTTGMRVVSVDIDVNPKTRESRLFKSIPQYIRKTGGTMLSMFVLYRPGAFFTMLSVPFFTVSLFLGIRFIWLIYIVKTANRTYLPSLILLSLSAFSGGLLLVMGIIGMLNQANRRLAEEQLYQLRHNEDLRGKQAG